MQRYPKLPPTPTDLFVWGIARIGEHSLDSVKHWSDADLIHRFLIDEIREMQWGAVWISHEETTIDPEMPPGYVLDVCIDDDTGKVCVLAVISPLTPAGFWLARAVEEGLVREFSLGGVVSLVIEQHEHEVMISRKIEMHELSLVRTGGMSVLKDNPYHTPILAFARRQDLPEAYKKEADRVPQRSAMAEEPSAKKARTADKYSPEMIAVAKELVDVKTELEKERSEKLRLEKYAKEIEEKTKEEREMYEKVQKRITEETRDTLRSMTAAWRDRYPDQASKIDKIPDATLSAEGTRQIVTLVSKASSDLMQDNKMLRDQLNTMLKGGGIPASFKALPVSEDEEKKKKIAAELKRMHERYAQENKIKQEKEVIGTDAAEMFLDEIFSKKKSAK